MIGIDRSSDDTKGDRSSLSFTEVTSNNVSVKRPDFLALGMWQDVAGDGQTLWGDVDFAYRAYKRGFSFRRAPNAICYHDDYATRDLAAASRRAEIAARRAVLLFQRYPELIEYLPMFRDKTPVVWGQDSFGLSCRKLMRYAASTRLSIRCLVITARWLEEHFLSPRLLRPLYRWIIGGYIFRGYRQGLRELKGASI
jgi:GT2 family glycosyltransferase